MGDARKKGNAYVHSMELDWLLFLSQKTWKTHSPYYDVFLFGE